MKATNSAAQWHLNGSKNTYNEIAQQTKHKEENKMSTVLFSAENGIAVITLNNPPQNRLSNQLIGDLAAAVQQTNEVEDLRAVLIRAEGDDFSFGAEVTGWPGRSPEEMAAQMEFGLALTNGFENLPVPLIAEVQGMCAGGAFEIAMRCDIIVASHDAKFRHTEKTLGAFTLLGGIQRVAERVGRTRAMQWAITSEEITADKAFETGLITQVVPRDQLRVAGQTWLEQCGKDAPTLSHAAHKKLLRAWSEGGIAAADALVVELTKEIFHSQDAQGAVQSAADALNAGQKRPKYPFIGK